MLRMKVYTPMVQPKNAAINIVGSNVSAIRNEILRAHSLLKSKSFSRQLKISNFYAYLFQSQEMPYHQECKNFLKIDFLTDCLTFRSLFDSRVKNLRERIEN